jgi:outer membrane protein TolC
LLLAQTREAELQVQAAQTQLGSGRASQADVFAARSQLEQLRDSATQTERSIAVATTQLARWIGAAAQRRSDARPVLVAPAWTASADLGAHLARHPQLAAAAQQEAMAEADTAIARAEEDTDWSVELMFSQRGPSYSNMVSINVSLPLQWNRPQRQGREVAARQALAARSAAEREDMQRAREAEVRTMLVEWRSHEQRLQRFDSNLLPLAKQRSSAVLTSYRGGAGPLSAVLDARRAEVELRTERLRIEIDVARLWAQLAYLDPHLAADSTRRTP